MSDGEYQEPRVSVSIARKIALPGYENVDIFMAMSGLEPGATDLEMEELLTTGDRAFSLLKARMVEKITAIKTARREE